MGTNSINPLSPLSIPVTLSSTANVLQIGVANSTIGLGLVPSLVPSGTSTFYTSGGPVTYTVPNTVSGSNVIGVMMYCWGAGGTAGYHLNNQSGAYGNALGGGGGFMSGFYPCTGGTQLSVVVGAITTTYAVTNGGASYAIIGPNTWAVYGGGFSGVFAGTYDPSTCLILAGGGGGTGLSNTTVYLANGGGGGYPNGLPPYQVSTNGLGVGPSIYVTGGTQTEGGKAGPGLPLAYNGNRWFGSPLFGMNSAAWGPGGGGWFGGGAGSANLNGVVGMAGGGGGSSYFDSNRITSVYYENGTAYNQLVTPGQTQNYTLAPPGGTTTMSSFGLSNYGNGAGTAGLVVIVPYVGTVGNCTIGVDSRLLVV
jgi:hypothetical protein